jgi:hypothetical protein
MNVALNLRAIVSQRLVVGFDGRRLPAAEILINTPMIRDLLRRGQVHEIKQAMEESLEEGMESFDQCLFRLHKEGKIEKEEALKAADSRDGLNLKFRLSGRLQRRARSVRGRVRQQYRQPIALRRRLSSAGLLPALQRIRPAERPVGVPGAPRRRLDRQAGLFDPHDVGYAERSIPKRRAL